MLFGMTGIQPVNTWVEVEVFFDSITDADRQWYEPAIRCCEGRRARAGNKAAAESIEDGHNGSHGDDSRRSRGRQRPRPRGDPVREAGTRTDGGRRNGAHAIPRGSVGRRRACTSVVAAGNVGVRASMISWLPTVERPPFAPVREAGARTDDALTPGG